MSCLEPEALDLAISPQRLPDSAHCSFTKCSLANLLYTMTELCSSRQNVKRLCSQCLLRDDFHNGGVEKTLGPENEVERANGTYKELL